MPAHPVASALIAAAGVPVAAPSANSFGRLSPTLPDHVLDDLDGRIDAVLDAGETAHGLESTVVDASQEPVVLYRPGAITIEALRSVCGEVVVWKPPQSPGASSPESLPSPGVGIRHYAPKARLVVTEEQLGSGPGSLLHAVEVAARSCSRVGVLLPANYQDAEAIRAIPNTVIFDWGEWSQPEQLGHNLFAGLRALDRAAVDVIMCPLPAAEGIGAAVRDRLLKATT
jgi:L-threonylcarbamoyladenylate synthase